MTDRGDGAGLVIGIVLGLLAWAIIIGGIWAVRHYLM